MTATSMLHGQLNMPVLSLIIWLPIGSALVLLCICRKYQNVFRHIALYTTLLQAVGIFWLVKNFSLPTHGAIGNVLRFVEKIPWIQLDLGNLGTLSANYFLGIDGFNLPFLLLAGIILPIGVVASWQVQKHTKAYFGLYLLLSTLIMGSFMALDFLLFYCFFEALLLPVYFFIGIWGGAQRTYAATKFFIYTLLGAMFILIAMISLGVSVYDPISTGINAGMITPAETPTAEMIRHLQHQVQMRQMAKTDVVHSFDMRLMQDAHNFLPGTLLNLEGGSILWGKPIRLIVFLGLLIGFLIKLPIFPFHAWLPSAHVEAPTAISIILSALLLKIGGYGLIRTAYGIFPEGAIYYGFWIGTLGLFSIIYASLNALAMQDLKKMIAYASIAHMGFFLLGFSSLTYEGINGALYQMVSHGLITALLFLIVGVLDYRTKNRLIENYSGLATPMPHYTAVAVLTFFAALGLPGFSGFIAELLIMLGTFKSFIFPKWIALFATMGIVLGAAYFVWTIKRLFFGKFSLRDSTWQASLKDLSVREYIMLAPLLLLIFILGVFPNFLLDIMSYSVSSFVKMTQEIGQENLKKLIP